MENKNMSILNDIPYILPNLIIRKFKKGILLDSGVALNDTAAFILEHCNGSNTVRDIMLSIQKEYNINQEIAKDDVIECIQALIDNGTITVKG